jgi:hypothetical protein
MTSMLIYLPRRRTNPRKRIGCAIVFVAAIAVMTLALMAAARGFLDQQP